MILKNPQKLSREEKIFKLRKLFKRLKRNKLYRKFSSSYFQIFRCLKGVLPPFDLRLSINIFSNNIFLNLNKIKQYNTLKRVSSGVYRIKITKKRLKHTVCIVLQKFLNTIKSIIYRRNLIITLTSPKFLRKKILKLFKDSFMHRNIYIKINPLKCFNGCRPKKKKRKKRARLKIFKII
jgi:hypothetical protein